MKESEKKYTGTSLPDILKIGGSLEKAIMHEKGYIQIPTDADGHEKLLNAADDAQWTINRGMGAIGYLMAINGDNCDHDYLQDLGWLLNGLADLNSKLANAKENIEESRRHLSDKEG